MKDTLIRLLFCGFIAPWVLTSCATQVLLKTVEPGKPVPQSETEAFVFGKIIFAEEEKEKVPSPWKPVVGLLHMESEKGTWMWIERDGGFYWIVPRGTYTILYLAHSRVCENAIQPQVTFSVPSEGNRFYLGTLRIDVEVKRFLGAVPTFLERGPHELEGLSGDEKRKPPDEALLRIQIKKINGIEIVEEFDTAKESLVVRNPDFASHKIQKNLMTMVPGRPPTIFVCEQRGGGIAGFGGFGGWSFSFPAPAIGGF